MMSTNILFIRKLNNLFFNMSHNFVMISKFPKKLCNSVNINKCINRKSMREVKRRK